MKESTNLLMGSDKQYWHRYLPLYEKELNSLIKVDRILEFGVFKGESIRWLNNKFPEAKIFASDILPIQPEWPISPKIEYLFVDQDDNESIGNLFNIIGEKLDLIIEDGSHFPEHQKNCLIQGVNHINSGGVYILEDLHTSHPEHSFYRKQALKYKTPNNILFRIINILPFGGQIINFIKNKFLINGEFISALNLLLCLEHLKFADKQLDENILKQFSQNSLFSSDEVVYLYEKISEIRIYKRSTLPRKCFNCDSDDFQYLTLKCECGAELYSNCDSMAAIIRIK